VAKWVHTLSVDHLLFSELGPRVIIVPFLPSLQLIILSFFLVFPCFNDWGEFLNLIRIMFDVINDLA
jgi:hypothetical protein